MREKAPLLLGSAVLILLGCSSGGAGNPRTDGAADLSIGSDPGDQGLPSDAAGGDGAGGNDLRAGGVDAGADLRAPADLLMPPDLWTGVLDVRIFVSNTCVVTTDPPSFAVHAGETFTVNWTNLGTSSSNVDIDKIDAHNQVPLIIGLEPAMSWHDTIRNWCGISKDPFSFRVTGCDKPYYMSIDCNKP